MIRRSPRELWLSLPSISWLLAFFLIPLVIVVAIAFRPADPMGGVGTGWTLASIRQVINTPYSAILYRTLWMTVLASLICVVVSLPVGLYLATTPARIRRWLLFLILVPFWTSFLVRIFAWKELLHPEGAIKQWLVALHMIEPAGLLMYTPGAVLVITIYSYLPFAILPIYAAAEKFDLRLLEAARDLGASRWHAFRHVTLPSIQRGIGSAFLLVFIPVLGSYVIPDVAGGASCEMLGNKIAQRVFADRNLPHACVLSTGLTLAVLLPLLATLFLRRVNRFRENRS